MCKGLPESGRVPWCLDAVNWGRSTGLVWSHPCIDADADALQSACPFNVTMFNAVGPKSWIACGLDKLGILSSWVRQKHLSHSMAHVHGAAVAITTSKVWDMVWNDGIMVLVLVLGVGHVERR